MCHSKLSIFVLFYSLSCAVAPDILGLFIFFEFSRQLSILTIEFGLDCHVI